MEEHPEDKVCAHCGARITEYKHGLSAGLVAGLVRLAQRGDEPVGIADLGMSYSQRCNFQKLRYWEMVEKVGDPQGKGGLWRITEQAKRFLSGEASVPKHVWTFRGKVRRREGVEVFFGEVWKDDWRYKYRPEYAREAQPVDGTPPGRLMQRELI